MHVEWLTDYDIINSTIKHPDIWPHVSEIGQDMDSFSWPKGDSFFAVGCYDGETYMGCACFSEIAGDEVELHTCLLPAAKGKAKLFGNMVTAFIFKNKPYDIISTIVPIANKLAKLAALKCGFVFDGCSVIFQSQVTERFILRRSNLCQLQ